jgi:hypothetical protein
MPVSIKCCYLSASNMSRSCVQTQSCRNAPPRLRVSHQQPHCTIVLPRLSGKYSCSSTHRHQAPLV